MLRRDVEDGLDHVLHVALGQSAEAVPVRTLPQPAPLPIALFPSAYLVWAAKAEEVRQLALQEAQRLAAERGRGRPRRGIALCDDAAAAARSLWAGNARMRWLLVEAAWRVATNKKRPETEALRNWADRIARRRGKRVAMVALARKLSGILYAMWRDGSVYDPAKLSGVHRRAAEKAA